MSPHDHRLFNLTTNTALDASTGQSYPSDIQRWRAVQTRDPHANNAFYYGAITTSIYCRPTCPGRVARRSNIVFFDNTSIAVRHGYRACKRCSPDLDVWDRDARGRELVHRAEAIIKNLSGRQENWTVEEVAKQLGIGGAHLHRLFKRYLGRTPKSYGHQRGISPIETSQQKHAIDVLSVECGMVQSQGSSNCPMVVHPIDQMEDFFVSNGFDSDSDFDISHNLCLPESNAMGSFDMCTGVPSADQSDLPSVDEDWTEWLSI